MFQCLPGFEPGKGLQSHPTLEILTLAVRETGVFRHNGCRTESPSLKPLITIECRDVRGVSGGCRETPVSRTATRFICCFSNLPDTEKSYEINLKSDCIYHFLIDMDPNGLPFGSKSIGIW